jgi:hypothetical protein
VIGYKICSSILTCSFLRSLLHVHVRISVRICIRLGAHTIYSITFKIGNNLTFRETLFSPFLSKKCPFCLPWASNQMRISKGIFLNLHRLVYLLFITFFICAKLQKSGRHEKGPLTDINQFFC